MADLRIFGTIFIILGCTFLKGHGSTLPPKPTSICRTQTVRGYRWNNTASGVTASQPCQKPYNRGQTFRTCTDGTWSEPEYSTCRTVAIADINTIYLIQYVCCGTTILTVLLTLFILVFAWRNPGPGTTILEISFGLAIIASNTAFIAGVNNTADELMCKITAVCLHYLPTVTVFHLFAIIFHLATLKVQTSPNSYCCLLFTAWGTPAIIVVLYGYFTTLEEYGNTENCWMVFSIRLFWVYYGTLMAICGLIFISVLGIIYRMKLPGRGPKLGSVIGIVPLFIVFITTIMAWVTGVISVNEYNDGLYITQIVFGTFNFLQGLAYLIVFGVLGSRARKAKAFQKSETRLSGMSLPTVTTYTGYKDDHVRNWSYSHHLKNTQRQNDMDFYSTDEDVQQRYLESRRNENQRNEETSQMTTREDLQDDTPEKRGSTVVVVHKEVVHNSQTTNGFRDSDDDGGITIENTKILVEGSQAVYQSQTPSDDRIESKDTEIRINAVDAAPDNEGTQPSSPITQRPRNVIDPPAPSRISVTEIETFTIDAPEENVTRNESNEFILQDEGEVVMEYRNANRAQNDNHPTTEHIDHKEASHDHSEGKPGLAYPSYLEAAAADYDASQTGSMIVYHEDEGNTLQHITNGIARGNGYEQADEDSINIGASSSPQPTPLIADTEYQPQSTSDMQKESQPTVKSSFQNKSKWGVSSSFLGRLREKIRPVSKTPNLRDSPPEVAVQQEPSQEPEPAYESKPQNNDQSSNFAIQSENLKDEGPHRRQWDRPDEDLLPPPTYNSEAPEAINRPPTPPSPFIGPPPLAPPPPPIPQSSPYPKHVSFANGEVEISSHL